MHGSDVSQIFLCCGGGSNGKLAARNQNNSRQDRNMIEFKEVQYKQHSARSCLIPERIIKPIDLNDIKYQTCMYSDTTAITTEIKNRPSNSGVHCWFCSLPISVNNHSFIHIWIRAQVPLKVYIRMIGSEDPDDWYELQHSAFPLFQTAQGSVSYSLSSNYGNIYTVSVKLPDKYRIAAITWIRTNSGSVLLSGWAITSVSSGTVAVTIKNITTATVSETLTLEALLVNSDLFKQHSASSEFLRWKGGLSTDFKDTVQYWLNLGIGIYSVTYNQLTGVNDSPLAYVINIPSPPTGSITQLALCRDGRYEAMWLRTVKLNDSVPEYMPNFVEVFNSSKSSFVESLNFKRVFTNYGDWYNAPFFEFRRNNDEYWQLLITTNGLLCRKRNGTSGEYTNVWSLKQHSARLETDSNIGKVRFGCYNGSPLNGGRYLVAFYSGVRNERIELQINTPGIAVQYYDVDGKGQQYLYKSYQTYLETFILV